MAIDFLHEDSKAKRPNLDRINELLKQNLIIYHNQMQGAIESGTIAEIFGEIFTPEGFLGLADQMQLEIEQAFPDTGKKNPIRSKAYTEYIKSNTNFILNIDWDSFLLSKKEDPILPFQQHIRITTERLLLLGNPKDKIIQNQAQIYLQADKRTQDGDARFFTYSQGEIRTDKTTVNASVEISRRMLPQAQEEYFHAIHELCLGTVTGALLTDHKIKDASMHVTHGSLLIDRILTATAASMGSDEYWYWRTKADEETSRYNERHINRPLSGWDETPLGKTVNERFLYPIVNLLELGHILYRRSHELQQFLFDAQGNTNDANSHLFEIISIQFGFHEKDLIFDLLDKIEYDENNPDFEDIGAQALEWGVKILKYYKGSTVEREIVTHHTDMIEPLDPQSLTYEVTDNLLQLINGSVTYDMTPTTQITIHQLASEVYERTHEKVQSFIQRFIPKDAEPGSFRPPKLTDETLQYYGIPRRVLESAIQIATEAYKKELFTKIQPTRLYIGKWPKDW